MAISFIAASADGADVAQGASATIPASVQPGDRLLAVVGTNSVSGYSHIAPAGWIQLGTSYGSADGGSQFASLYTKIAQIGEPDTQVIFDVTPAGSKDVAVVVAYRGTLTTPVVASAAGVLPHAGVSSTGIVSAQCTVPELPCTLVALATKKGGTLEITFTSPSGFTSRGTDFVTGGGAMACGAADGAAGGTGTTAVGSWGTNTSSAAATAFLVPLTEGDPPPVLAPVFRRYTVTGWFPAPA